jgi:hypothetical protein
MYKKMVVHKSNKVQLTGLQSDFRMIQSLKMSFYKTMNHYCTIHGSRFERNVKVIDVFPEEINNPDVNKKEFDGVIFQGREIKVVFEINGAEHFKNKKRINSDKIKMQLLNSKNIDRIVIPNQYVKHYEFIRELMTKIKGGVYQKTIFDSFDSTTV